MHEEDYGIRTTANGDLVFTLPDGRVLQHSYRGRFRGNFDELKARNEENGLEIIPFTAISQICGSPMDHSMAGDAMIQRE